MSLYLIATPIGNLDDFSFHAIKTIKKLDYLLCEDTRRTRILLNHYGLKISLRSFHAYSEKKKLESIVQQIEKGKSVGLVSDAGTPGISDPGSLLVAACKKQGIKVISIPGPCAAIVALTASGLDTTRFQFLGFLPRKKGKLMKTFKEILNYPGTTICYESPHRLIHSLKILTELDPQRKCVIARELTKKFEEYIEKTAENLLSYFSDTPPRGEIVLMISE